MTSSKAYMEYVAEQLGEAGVITYKPMFGEYGVYCDGKFCATVEDDQLYLKITEAGRALLPGAVIAEPHQGARFFLIDELDDRAFLAQLFQATCAALPAPKQKKPRAKAGRGCAQKKDENK